MNSRISQGFESMLLLIGITFKIVVVASVLMGAVAYLIYVERKVAAFAQDRIGPNRAGGEFGIPFGLLQPLADGAKMLLKEGVVPTYVNKPLYTLAPLIAIIAALIAFAVIPFGPVGVNGELIDFQIAPGVDIGILYIFAISSLAVYGVILAGWSSNNKYSFIGALRSSAQLISYEIPLGLSILGVVLAMSTLDLNAMINWQDHHVWGCRRLAGRVLDLPDQRVRRDQPASVRPSRIGARAGRRLSYRVFGNEVRHVLPRGIRARDQCQLHDGDPLSAAAGTFRFVSEPGADRASSSGSVKCGGHPVQGDADDPLHHVGPLDSAAVSLRPAHGPGLEVADSAGTHEPGRHGGNRSTDSQLVDGEWSEVRADDPKLKKMEPPRLNLLERFYLLQIADGLGSDGPAYRRA